MEALFENHQAWFNALSIVATVLSIIAMSLSIRATILGFHDRQQHPSLNIQQRKETLPVQLDEINFKNPADVPAIRAVLVNQGVMVLYPKEAVISVNGHLLQETTIYNLEDRLLTDPLEHNRFVAFAFYGQEIYEKLPDSLHGQDQIKLEVTVTFENGTTCKSNQFRVSKTSLQSNLEILPWGM